MYDPSGSFTLTIHPNGRAQADEYYHGGATFIEGREGSSYIIRFTNRTANRVQVILSVDGLDVLRGQPAGIQSEGYVVDGHAIIDIPGWKVDGSTAAQFEFAKVGSSYTTQSGQGSTNAGVIGAMVFRESHYATLNQNTYSAPITNWNTPPVAPWDTTTYLRAAAVDSSVHPGVVANHVSITRTASGTTVNNEVGTAFGQAIDHSTRLVQFMREDQHTPNAIMAIYYDSARNLEKRGIVLRKKGMTSTYSNNPFPAYSPGAKPPPGWQG